MDAPAIPLDARRRLARFEALRDQADTLRDELDQAAHEAARALRAAGLSLPAMARVLGRPDSPVSRGQARRMLDGERSPRAWDGRSVLVQLRRREARRG